MRSSGTSTTPVFKGTVSHAVSDSSLYGTCGSSPGEGEVPIGGSLVSYKGMTLPLIGQGRAYAGAEGRLDLPPSPPCAWCPSRRPLQSPGPCESSHSWYHQPHRPNPHSTSGQPSCGIFPISSLSEKRNFLQCKYSLPQFHHKQLLLFHWPSVSKATHLIGSLSFNTDPLRPSWPALLREVLPTCLSLSPRMVQEH